MDVIRAAYRFICCESEEEEQLSSHPPSLQMQGPDMAYVPSVQGSRHGSIPGAMAGASLASSARQALMAPAIPSAHPTVDSFHTAPTHLTPPLHSAHTSVASRVGPNFFTHKATSEGNWARPNFFARPMGSAPIGHAPADFLPHNLAPLGPHSSAGAAWGRLSFVDSNYGKSSVMGSVPSAASIPSLHTSSRSGSLLAVTRAPTVSSKHSFGSLPRSEKSYYSEDEWGRCLVA